MNVMPTNFVDIAISVGCARMRAAFLVASIYWILVFNSTWALAADGFVVEPPGDGDELLEFDSSNGDSLYGSEDYHPVSEIYVESVAFVGEGRSFVVGGTQGQLSAWNTGTGQPMFELANLGTSIQSIQPFDD
jgi:hypothetical protein